MGFVVNAEKPRWKSARNAAGAALSYAASARRGYGLPLGLDEVFDELREAARNDTVKKLRQRVSRALEHRGNWGRLVAEIENPDLGSVIEAALEAVLNSRYEAIALTRAEQVAYELESVRLNEVEWRWRDLSRCLEPVAAFRRFERLWARREYDACFRLAEYVRRRGAAPRDSREALAAYLTSVGKTERYVAGELRYDFEVVDEVAAKGRQHDVDDVLARLSMCWEEAPPQMVFGPDMFTLGHVAQYAATRRRSFQLRSAADSRSPNVRDAVHAAIDAKAYGVAAEILDLSDPVVRQG